MKIKGREPVAAATAVILALSAAGYAAAGGSSVLRAHGRTSVTPPPCAHDRDRNCGHHEDAASNKGVDRGKGDEHGKKGDDHGKSTESAPRRK